MSPIDGPVYWQATLYVSATIPKHLQHLIFLCRRWRSLSSLRYLFFLKIEITDFRVPFMTYSDTIKKLPQASECLMGVSDFWPDTSAGYGA